MLWSPSVPSEEAGDESPGRGEPAEAVLRILEEVEAVAWQRLAQGGGLGCEDLNATIDTAEAAEETHSNRVLEAGHEIAAASRGW